MKSVLLGASLFCFTLVLTTACFDAEEIGGMINEMQKDQEKAAVFADTLKEHYEVVEVQAIYLESTLNVVFINSPLMRLDEDQRDSLAKEIGVRAQKFFGAEKVRSGVLSFGLVGDVEMDEKHLENNGYLLFEDRPKVGGGFGTEEPERGNDFGGDTVWEETRLRVDSGEVVPGS